MVRIKICGITNASDAEAACEAGADSLGFNFYDQSPRYISQDAAAKIRAAMPPEALAVGVFVNAKADDITHICSSLEFHAAQLHGDESPEDLAELARTLVVVKAFRLGADFDLATLDAYPQAFAFLLDAALPGQYGGTGQIIDWSRAQRAAATRRIILAGGLNVENVAAAIASVRPYGVDVASGLEIKPGKKDHARVREFIQEVRRAEKQLDASPERSHSA